MTICSNYIGKYSKSTNLHSQTTKRNFLCQKIARNQSQDIKKIKEILVEQKDLMGKEKEEIIKMIDKIVPVFIN